MRKYIILTIALFVFWRINAQIPDNEMIQISAGTFTMGNATYARESPTRNVSINAFYMSKYNVTNAQFAHFLNAYGSSIIQNGDFAGKPLFVIDSWGITKNNDVYVAAIGYENFPAVKITWYGANEFCKWYGGRLPTEAEWEFAAKGGKNENFTYSGSNTASTVAWFYDNSTQTNKEVGQKTPNSLGLYDMSGNVYQWCSDWYGRYNDILTSINNPEGVTNGVSKVIRGGYRSLGSTDLHLTHRESLPPYECLNFVGFRMVKTTLTPIENVKDNSIKIFPNPAKTTLNVSSNEQIKSIEIFNCAGMLVLNILENTNTLSLSNLLNGTYLVRIKNNSDKLFIDKLIIKK